MLLAACAAPAARPGFLRGVALGLFGDEPPVDYRRQLDELRALGATDVSLVLTGFVKDIRSSEVYAWPGFTPTPDEVAALTREARSRGLRVTLFPFLRLEHRSADEWRGRLAPPDLESFFRSYEAFVLPYARAAGRAGASTFVVGSELVSTETREDLWRPLIARVRSLFPGTLLYSANWDRYEHVPFWDALDAVGISAYYELAPKERFAESPVEPPPPSPPGRFAPARDDRPRLTVDELARAWRPILDRLAAFRRRVGKPIVFTEVGYPSQEGASARPWDEHRRAPFDAEEQRRAFAAFAETFAAPSPVDGAYVWIWFERGGARDRSYTPRGKPAEIVLRNFYRPAQWLPPPR